MKFWPARTRTPFPQSQLVAAFGEFTPQMQQDLDNARIVTFILARSRETSPAAVDWCRNVIDECCEQVDCSTFGEPPKSTMVRGRVKDMESLKKLARTWVDHPDFLYGWGVS